MTDKKEDRPIDLDNLTEALELGTAIPTNIMTRLVTELAEARRVACERVGADPEVRRVLLYEIGTTDPAIMTQVFADYREMRKNDLDQLIKLSRAGTELMQEYERLNRMNVEILRENGELQHKLLTLRREMYDALVTIWDALSIGERRYKEDFLTCCPWTELRERANKMKDIVG